MQLKHKDNKYFGWSFTLIFNSYHLVEFLYDKKVSRDYLRNCRGTEYPKRLKISEMTPLDAPTVVEFNTYSPTLVAGLS